MQYMLLNMLSIYFLHVQNISFPNHWLRGIQGIACLYSSLTLILEKIVGVDCLYNTSGSRYRGTCSYTKKFVIPRHLFELSRCHFYDEYTNSTSMTLIVGLGDPYTIPSSLSMRGTYTPNHGNEKLNGQTDSRHYDDNTLWPRGNKTRPQVICR